MNEEERTSILNQRLDMEQQELEANKEELARKKQKEEEYITEISDILSQGDIDDPEIQRQVKRAIVRHDPSQAQKLLEWELEEDEEKRKSELHNFEVQLKAAQVRLEQAKAANEEAETRSPNIDYWDSQKNVADANGKNVGTAIGVEPNGDVIVDLLNGTRTTLSTLRKESPESGITLQTLGSAAPSGRTGGQVMKDVKAMHDDMQGIQNLKDYLDVNSDLTQGISGVVDRFMAITKTAVNEELSDAEFKELLMQGLLPAQISGMKGEMGGGVMSNQDIEWLSQQLGGKPSLFKNRRAADHLIKRLLKRKVSRYNLAVDDINSEIASGKFARKTPFEKIELDLGIKSEQESKAEAAKLAEYRRLKAKASRGTR